MFTKSKMILAAALVLGSASAAFADMTPYTPEQDAYLRSPNAPVPTYQHSAPAVRGLIEGRNVGVRGGVRNVPAKPFDRNDPGINI